MKENIVQNPLDYIAKEESKKIVGKVCKRFELEEERAKLQGKDSIDFKELTALKKQVKNLLYEWTRDLRDTIKNGKVIFDFVSKRKEGDTHG